MEGIAVCGSWILCVGALLGLPVCTALYIHDCPSGVRDVTEDTEVSFTCGRYTDQVDWSSFDGNDYRTENYIGRCNSDRCTSLNWSIFFLQVKAISKKKYESTLYIRNLTRHQDFSLHCNEGYTAATCKLRVVAPAILKDCNVYIRDWQVHATCVVEHMYASDGKYWCTWSVNNFGLTSNFQDPLTEYWLDTRVYRKGVCSASHTMPYNLGNYTYSIKIDPGRWNTVKTLEIVPVSIVPKTCQVQLSRWKVYGVCTVQWLDTISDTSDCLWRFSYQSFPLTTPEDLKGLLSSLTFVTVDSVRYKRRNCSFKQNMPVFSGDYRYSLRVSSHSDAQFSESLHIEKPDEPQHNCSKMFLEGSNMTCTCFTSNLGNPPAQIEWAETSKEHLVIEGINRKRNGTVTTCSLTWGSINYTTPYMILVAFGPSVTYISSSEETSGDETKTVLVCTASDVYPSAFFRWNISCENEIHNETTNRCTLPTSPVADQMTIECTASNQIFPQVSSTTIYVLKPTRELTYTDNPYQGGVIAGSVVAVLLLVVIVAAIILFIKRRKVINKPETQTPTVHFAAPSGDIYTIAGTTTGDHREDEYVTVRDTSCPNSILQPQTPVVRFAAPSGDLYSIAGPATAREVNQATMEGATGRMQHKLPCHQTKNTTYNKNQGTESEKMPIKPKPTRFGEKSRHHWSSKAEFDNKLETQRPAAHFAAPSGDLYAIAGPATAGGDNPMTEATSNTSYTPKSSSGHKARDISNMTNTGMDSKKMAIKPKPKRFGKQSRQVTGYMNVTQVPTDSGLGVHHVAPWAAMSETRSSDARVLDTSNISEDEYNVLRFQEDHTRQEDHDVTYSHLNIK